MDSVSAGLFLFLGIMSGKRISFFIDGFNLYHALAADARYKTFRWLNLRILAEQFIRPFDILSDVFYFTAYSTWNPSKVRRHKLFVRAQEHFGVKPVFGEFRRTTKNCRRCGRPFDTFEEKETDVNIAIQLFEQAYRDTYDIAIILSGDSDQLPALRAVRKNFPAKGFGVVIPPGRAAELLKKEADFHRKVKYKHLLTSRLPSIIRLKDGSTLTCPSTW